MKLSFVLYCISLIVHFAVAGIPLPQPGDPQEHLSKNCRIPDCPVIRGVENHERVINLPYPPDCLQYIECRGSEARVVPCPPDEVFDKNTFTCSPRRRVDCVPCYQEAP